MKSLIDELMIEIDLKDDTANEDDLENDPVVLDRMINTINNDD